MRRRPADGYAREAAEVALMTDDSQPLRTVREMLFNLVQRSGRDLTMRQLGVLLTCYVEDGPHTVRSLAKRLSILKSGIIQSLDALESLGLVQRVPEPDDRRSILINRTAAGLAYVARVRG